MKIILDFFKLKLSDVLLMTLHTNIILPLIYGLVHFQTQLFVGEYIRVLPQHQF